MVFKSTFEDSTPPSQFRDSLADYFWHQLDVHADRTLLVDFASGRQWTGRQIKEKASRIASYLVEQAGLKSGDSCVFFYPNEDYIHLTALGVLFAGGSICAGARDDPVREHKYMLDVMQPAMVFAAASLYNELQGIKSESLSSTTVGGVKLNYKLCFLNDQDEPYQATLNGDSIGLHKHLLAYEPNPKGVKLPVQVDPDAPAAVLLTSGSTGHPKPVARSHRNSIYVCYSLNTAHSLWPMDCESVLAGHQPLDHGTGSFNLKMTLAKGLKMIVINNYQFETLVTAIDRYKVTDCILGSALLHNFMCEPESTLGKYDLSSLRNFIAVGSRLASHELAVKFMEKYPNMSIRQACGATECGFTSCVPADEARTDSRTVGLLLPNLTIKLIDYKTGEEITEFDREGELFIAGPTVSRGYLGANYADQTRAAFLSDGFYKTNDICLVTKDNRIVIKGRFNDVLCLGDGWKVLPFEIESALMTHPGIKEAAVIGIPHPNLPTCHAPRAYVVPTDSWRDKLTEQVVLEFAESHLSEPKQLDGGVRIIEELPRITIGKVDKRALRKLDGYL